MWRALARMQATLRRRTQPSAYIAPLLPLLCVVVILYVFVDYSALAPPTRDGAVVSTTTRRVGTGAHMALEQDAGAMIRDMASDATDDDDDDYEPNAANATVTIVTAYFNMEGDHKIKHSHSFYLETGKNLLAIKSPMIVFTDVDIVAQSRARIAPDQPTHVIRMGLRDLKIFKTYLADIKALHGKDPERHLYSAELYALYHAKAEIMRAAAELNPFSTTKMLWVDFGSMRDWGGIEAKDYRNYEWPAPARRHLLGEKGHVLIQGTGGIRPQCQVNWVNADPASPGPVDLPVFKDSSAVPETTNYWVAGALFGGDVDALVTYERVYDDALKRYMESGRAKPSVTLIDQHLMGAIACERTDLVHVLRPPRACCEKRTARKWFFMYMYLRSGDYPAADYTAQELKDRGKARPSGNSVV